MLTIMIFLLLAMAFYTGYRRGLVLQLVYVAGYTITFIVAQNYYKKLGKMLELWVPYPAPTAKTQFVLFDSSMMFDMDQVFYAGFAFILVMIAGWLITRFVGMLSYSLTFIPILKQGNDLAGGIVSGLMMLFGLTIVLTLLATVPLPVIQNQFSKSNLAQNLVNHTPIMSNLLESWWVTKIIK